MARRKLDFYETEARVTQALLDRVNITGRVIEPCNGDGAIANVLRQSPYVREVITNDVDPGRPAGYHDDARDPTKDIWKKNPLPDWVVTNPPFKHGIDILKIATANATVGVAFLLRLTFLEPTRDRGRWLQRHAGHLSDIIIFNPRPSFTKDGNTDSATVAWLVFRMIPQATKVHFVRNWR